MNTKLQELFPKCASTISSIIKQFDTTGSVLSKARSGWPSKVNEQLKKATI